MRLAVTTLLVVTTLTFAGKNFAADIESVRLWRAPDNTRLVLDLSGAVEHKSFVLSNPYRLVVDVKNAALKTTFKDLDLSGTPIKGVRSGVRGGSDLRLVFDLNGRAEVKSFALKAYEQYGDRLVIDIYGRDAVAVEKKAVSKVVVQDNRKIVIAIDAGHGGEDPGALSPVKGQYEKNVTLAIAKELQRQINAEKGFRGELVRTGDYFIPLRKRTEIARKKGADLFVSIHADAAPRSSAFGASVYALSERGATSETARWLADAENQSDLIGGAGNVSLDDKDKMLAGVLLDLSMTASLSSSLNVGQKVLSNMGGITPLHKRRVEQAGFMVLKSPDIPSILVETGFISNPNEAKKLHTANHQQALARSITSGVKQFFHENPPPGTYVAWLRDEGKIAAGPREHVVARGESLALIAQRYQISLASLRSANKLNGDVIKVSQTLHIPATALAAQ